MIFRVFLAAVGAAALVASLAVERPERFGLIWPCALLMVIVAAGAVAADAVPLRRIPLACSIVTVALGACLFSRAPVQIPLSIGIVTVQFVALTWPQPRAHDPRREPVYTRRKSSDKPSDRRGETI